ncbi:phosphatase [Plasmodium brasilianum]|uniref:Phosphatase n=1 Tax=Plasmodium brasilianum TaxID=5824 RepID=A0ACB9YEP3_PLABR|nr:phosphatase [Plasmodium brasilianum]
MLGRTTLLPPLRFKRSICVKYLKLLFYLKKHRFEKKWNRYYCCLFQTAEKEITTTLKKVVHKTLSKDILSIKNKKGQFENFVSLLLTKPVKIASFDFDGTLINTVQSKHVNNLVYNERVLTALVKLSEKGKETEKKYKFVIFSNQTNVSSCAHNYDNIKYHKLPIFFSKIQGFKNALSYFHSLFSSEEKQKQKHQRKEDKGETEEKKKKRKKKKKATSLLRYPYNITEEGTNQFYCFILRLMEKIIEEKNSVYLCRRFYARFSRGFLLTRPRGPPPQAKEKEANEVNAEDVTNVINAANEETALNVWMATKRPAQCRRKMQNSEFLNYFFSIGKCEIREIDIYAKPNDGQYSLYICLEAIKYLIILNCYFKYSCKLGIEEINGIENKELQNFFLLGNDIFGINEIRELTKNLKRRYFDINKISLRILDTYTNFLLKRTKAYSNLRETNYDNSNSSSVINFFFNDQMGDDGGVSFAPSIEEKQLLALLNEEKFIQNIIPCLICKNKIMKRLAMHFAGLLFNFEDSFYIGNNVGRPYDKSDVDLKFAQRIGIKNYDDTWFQNFENL